MRALTRNLDFVSQVSKFVTKLGWDNYATDHEDANGQFEQNFQFADALTTCDRAVFYRYMVESLAQQRGLIATFMPKPFATSLATAATSTSACGATTRTCSSATRPRTRAASGCPSSPTTSSAD